MSDKMISASTLVAVAGVVLAAGIVAQSENQIAFVHVAGAQQRLRYLATAKIWSDPGDVTPDMLLSGRSLKQSAGAELEAAIRGEPLPCAFATPGIDLGGATPKFACQTPGGTKIRVKYSDGSRWQPRDFFSGRGGETPVGSRIRLRPDLSDHHRLPRLPGGSDVGSGTPRPALVPRNIPTKVEPSGHG